MLYFVFYLFSSCHVFDGIFMLGGVLFFFFLLSYMFLVSNCLLIYIYELFILFSVSANIQVDSIELLSTLATDG